MAVALVGISFPWVETTELAKNILSELLLQCEIIDTTSIFKKRPESLTDFEATIEFIVSVSTQQSAIDFANRLNEIAAKFPPKRAGLTTAIRLLLFDRLVMMTPDLTLPHPSLQFDNLTLRLSSEIWSQYEHPILRQSLRELSDQRSEHINVEFIMQGQKLFD